MTTEKRATDVLVKYTGPLSFGMFLRAARTSLDLTQPEMGKLLGISKANVCDIEKGRQLVAPELAKKIAKKSGLSEKLAVQACLQDLLKQAKIKYEVKLIEAS